MSQSTRPAAPLYTQMDITPTTPPSPAPVVGAMPDHGQLLHDILMALDRQNELMEELITQVASGQKQRRQRTVAVERGQPAARAPLSHRFRIARQSANRISHHVDDRNQRQPRFPHRWRFLPQRIHRSLRPAIGPFERRAPSPRPTGHASSPTSNS